MEVGRDVWTQATKEGLLSLEEILLKKVREEAEVSKRPTKIIKLVEKIE